MICDSNKNLKKKARHYCLTFKTNLFDKSRNSSGVCLLLLSSVISNYTVVSFQSSIFLGNIVYLGFSCFSSVMTTKVLVLKLTMTMVLGTQGKTWYEPPKHTHTVFRSRVGRTAITKILRLYCRLVHVNTFGHRQK